jgi:hypothetical protein
MKKRGQIIKPDRDLELAEDTVQYADLLMRHIEPCGSDLILLVLKGHLVAEHLLEKLMLRMLGLSQPTLKDCKIDLSFCRKLEIVTAVCRGRVQPPDPGASVLESIKKLNEVRNKLVHNLDPKNGIENEVRGLIRDYYSREKDKREPGKQLPEELKVTLIRICQDLQKLRLHHFRLMREG